jgi:hypothetical protein
MDSAGNMTLRILVVITEINNEHWVGDGLQLFGFNQVLKRICHGLNPVAEAAILAVRLCLGTVQNSQFSWL